MSVPTLTDAKAQLNVTGNDHDELLLRYLNASLALVEARVGPSTVQTFTETTSARGTALNLSYRPISAITSITPQLDGFPTFTGADVEFDARSGSVWRTDFGSLAGRWDVVYDAGWEVFPDNYHLAVLVTVQFLWRTQRGGSRRPDQGGTDDVNLRLGVGVSRLMKRDSFTLPAQAEMLIADGIYFGGIA